MQTISESRYLSYKLQNNNQKHNFIMIQIIQQMNIVTLSSELKSIEESSISTIFSSFIFLFCNKLHKKVKTR